MGALIDRFSVLRAYASELWVHGLPEFTGDADQDIVMFLDGVGGFQFIPLLARRSLRESNLTIGTAWFRWQTPIPGLMLVDLMYRSRNQRSATMLARKLIALRRAHPGARLHIVAYSGGTGVAVFALERLRGRVAIETLVLAGPALSPQYNLAPAMRGVRRCYVLVSQKDRWLLGAGTRLFGTMDRRRVCSAGMVGFVRPPDLSPAESGAYERIREIHWNEELRGCGHSGGHTGWTQVSFLKQHLHGLLTGTTSLPLRPLDSAAAAGKN